VHKYGAAPLDRVITSAPVDRVAAQVTSTGTHFAPKLKPAETYIHQETPLGISLPPKALAHLVGRKFGRFTVIGFIPNKRKAPDDIALNGREIAQTISGTACWLVRCLCGTYETRKSKAIRNPANRTDACRACRQWRYLRREEYKKRHGQWPSDDYGWS
jgi:hypothetical protein